MKSAKNDNQPHGINRLGYPKYEGEAVVTELQGSGSSLNPFDILS